MGGAGTKKKADDGESMQNDDMEKPERKESAQIGELHFETSEHRAPASNIPERFSLAVPTRNSTEGTHDKLIFGTVEGLGKHAKEIATFTAGLVDSFCESLRLKIPTSTPMDLNTLGALTVAEMQKFFNELETTVTTDAVLPDRPDGSLDETGVSLTLAAYFDDVKSKEFGSWGLIVLGGVGGCRCRCVVRQPPGTEPQFVVQELSADHSWENPEERKRAIQKGSSFSEKKDGMREAVQFGPDTGKEGPDLTCSRIVGYRTARDAGVEQHGDVRCFYLSSSSEKNKKLMDKRNQLRMLTKFGKRRAEVDVVKGAERVLLSVSKVWNIASDEAVVAEHEKHRTNGGDLGKSLVRVAKGEWEKRGRDHDLLVQVLDCLTLRG